VIRSLFSTRSTILALVAALLAVGAATALAEVTVYSNDFSSRHRFNEIATSGGGKRCSHKYRAKSKAMLAAVKKSPGTCAFKPPVYGDDVLPNQTFSVDAKILKRTPKSVRGGSFIEVILRAGGGKTGYSLRIFPQKQRFELRRGPSGSGFPSDGKSKAIHKINQRNKVVLIAKGAQIIARVNGKDLTTMTDINPGAVVGRKLRFAVGSQANKDKKVVATFKRVAVAVPDP
jgi:hypothetical protein